MTQPTSPPSYRDVLREAWRLLDDRIARSRVYVSLTGVSLSIALVAATALPPQAVAPPVIEALPTEVAEVNQPVDVSSATHAPRRTAAAERPTARTNQAADAPPVLVDGLRVTTEDEAATTTTPPPPPAKARTAPPASNDPARVRFEQRFPAQAAAGQQVDRPDTTRWALLIGINDHSGRTRDNLGSRQDAEDLHRALESYGWRPDHMVLLTDRIATRENIEQGIAWLARKANGDSVVVFHYSGHTKQWPGRDVDNDGEVTDEALWPTDNRHMTDREFAERMAAVRPSRMWIDIGACEAAGYDDGLGGPGRILTFSSREDQKSYEDPSVDNSVWGSFMVDEAIRGGYADSNGDGQVTVEEAFTYAAPRAIRRTEGQKPHGRQDPQIRDDVPGDFSLTIPAPPPPPSSTPPNGGGDDDDDDCIVLCGATEPRRRSVTRG